jgi:hypothetical protein
MGISIFDCPSEFISFLSLTPHMACRAEAIFLFWLPLCFFLFHKKASPCLITFTEEESALYPGMLPVPFSHFASFVSFNFNPKNLNAFFLLHVFCDQDKHWGKKQKMLRIKN